MALIVLHDPYEWFDPEEGRKGVVVHSSQIGGREHLTYRESPGREHLTYCEDPDGWNVVWDKLNYDRDHRS